jgi:hypothetical protein
MTTLQFIAGVVCGGGFVICTLNAIRAAVAQGDHSTRLMLSMLGMILTGVPFANLLSELLP